MKKLCSFALCVCLLFSAFGCSYADGFYVGSSVPKLQQKEGWICNIVMLDCFRTERGYAFTISDGKRVSDYFEFSEDRELLRSSGLELKDIPDLSVFLGLTFDEAQEKYGPFHADMGSGFHQYCYFTTDMGYIVYFIKWPQTINGEIRSDIITSVDKMDMFTFEIVESVTWDGTFPSEP